VATDRPQPIDDDRRVIPFRLRRGQARRSFQEKWPIANSRRDYSPVADLSKYEGSEGNDDYRHRMVVNAVAIVYTAGLVVVGVWIAIMMSR
jgi:hypothetical protein